MSMEEENITFLAQILAGIAHEISAPLSALNSNQDLLRTLIERLEEIMLGDHAPSVFKKNPEVKKLFHHLQQLSTINEEALKRLLAMVTSLRNFVGGEHDEMEEVNIHESLENTLTILHHELRDRIEVVKQFGEVPAIRCYRNQINQVFMNLLMNACQAIEKRGKIVVRTQRRQNHLMVEIQDSGRGIAPDDLEHIFEPGFTRKGTGTGLGLAIVKQIVEVHRGRIEVKSKPEEGTLIRLSLPYRSSMEE